MFITGTPFGQNSLDLLLVSLALSVVLLLVGLVTNGVLGSVQAGRGKLAKVSF